MAAMKNMAAIFFAVSGLMMAAPLQASSLADAREIARINNCPPKKIEVYQQSLGIEGQTIYRVDCNMPKATGETAEGANAVLIGCKDSLCTLLRPITAEKK